MRRRAKQPTTLQEYVEQARREAALQDAELAAASSDSGDAPDADGAGEIEGGKGAKRGKGSTGSQKGKKKRRRSTDVLLVLVFVIGLGIFLYPTISQYWNDMVSSRAVATFSREISTVPREERAAMWQSAVEYNERHTAARKGAYKMGPAEMADYEAELDPTGTAMMGHIEIPRIGVDVPIYHGVEEGVLQIAAGHLPWSSLPVGGNSTHTVLSGHRGLPTSRLFTDLDQMEVGDIFLLHILDKTLAYQVDQIRIVLPEEVDHLQIIDGMDLCTLVTCTPYAVNTHRLLVRGQRIDYISDEFVQADAVILDRVMVASAVAVPVFVFLLVFVFVRTSRKHARVYRVGDMVVGSRRVARKLEEALGIPVGTAEANAKAAHKQAKLDKRNNRVKRSKRDKRDKRAKKE